MDANSHISQGIQHAKSAIAFDQNGQLQEALHYYTLTLQSLNAAIAIDVSDQRKEVTQKKANEYAARKSQLEARIVEAQQSGQLPPPAISRQSASDGWSNAPNSPMAGHDEFNNNGGARQLPPKPLPPMPPTGTIEFAGAINTHSNNNNNDNALANGMVAGMRASSSAAAAAAAAASATTSSTQTATIGLGSTQSPAAYNADNAYKVLVLWVTDMPVHARLQQLRDAGHDVLMTQTFAEGMKVLRRNTNITHVVNNMHRAGGKLAATTELVSLVNKYDDQLPIILTTFEDEKKKNKKRGGVSDSDLQQCMALGASRHVHSMDELLAALKELVMPSKKNANLGPPPLKPVVRNWGKSVFNANGLEYFVGDKIGGGNFGLIYDCKDVFAQDYVCKILKTNRPEEEVQADWAKETQFLFTLNHPNIVQLYDAFCYNSLYHMIMERCTGSMRDYVERHGPLSGPDVVSAGGMILAGLHHIHQRNIIHRDLHVDNILYAPPRHPKQKLCIKISDFGISKLLRPTENAAVTFIGRDYDYCPELVTKGHTTKRSDIYQLGLVLYHIYTGQHALSANDGNNVVQIVTSGLARSRAEQLETKLGDVIAIMLRRAPEYRYKDCIAAGASVALADGTARTIDALAAAAPSERVVAPAVAAASRVEPAQCADAFAKGVKRCVRVTLEDGRTLDCTPDHRLLCAADAAKAGQSWRAAAQCDVGQRLIVAPLVAPLDTPDVATEACFVVESESPITTVMYNMATVDERRRALAYARLCGAVDGGRRAVDAAALRDDLACAGLAALPARGALTPAVLGDARTPVAFVREWLAALFGACGAVIVDDENSAVGGVRVKLLACEPQLRATVRAALLACGCSADNNDLVEFAERVGFRHCATQQARLAAAVVFVRKTRLGTAASWRDTLRAIGAEHLFADKPHRSSGGSGSSRAFTLRVVSVVDAGKQRVYDLTVPSHEAFVANGVAVHNCVETAAHLFAILD